MRINDILQDIQTLANDIGPRPPLSQGMLNALDFVEQRLKMLGFAPKRDVFFSPEHLFMRWAPAGVLTIAGIWLSGLQNRWLRPIGVGLLGIAAWGARQTRLGTPTWYEQLMVQHPAENLYATLPASGERRERLVFIAHIDSDRHRLMSSAQLRNFLGDACTTIERLPTLAVTLPQGKAHWVRRSMAAFTAVQLTRLLLDEGGTPLPGANDNASGVAILLALAAALNETPLQHTEVVLAFTEADTLSTRGLEALLHEHRDDWQDARWIVLDSVGAGELCWVVNDTTRPERALEKLVQQLADANRHWGLFGRPLAMPDPSAPLQSEHFDTLVLVGYQRETDYAVQWRTRGDATDIIEPDTLAKTWDVLWSLVERIEEGAAND